MTGDAEKKSGIGPINIPTGLLDDIDIDFLKIILKIIKNGQCFEKKKYKELYRYHNEWYNHVNNILRYIGDFCTETNFSLTGDEKTIIVAAAMVHDVGKSLYEYLPPSQNNQSDNGVLQKNLEKSHHVLSFFFIRDLIGAANKGKVNSTGKKGFQTHFSASMDALNDKPVYLDYLKCIAWISLRHKTTSEDLLFSFKPGLHKYYTREGKPVSDDIYSAKGKEFFNWENVDNEEIKHINDFLKSPKEAGLDRFSILSALLQLGDKLDISKKRIKEAYLFLEILRDDLTYQPDLREKLFPPEIIVRWYQFYYTQEPTIKRVPEIRPASKPSNPFIIEITIPYVYPEDIKNDFLYFRYHSEKDFDDLGIVSILERSLQVLKNNEDIRIIIQRQENRKDKNIPIRPFGLTNRKERIAYCLRKVCDYLQNCKSNNDTESLDIMAEKLRDIWGNFDLDKICCHQGSSDNSTDCPILSDLIDKFIHNYSQMTHPDWEQDSIILPANIRRLLCSIETKSENEKINASIQRLKSDNVVIGLSRLAHAGLGIWKEDAIRAQKAISSGTLFSFDDRKTRVIPTSLDIAYLLNLFRHLKGESLTVDDIVMISGMDRGRILKYCGWLEHEGYFLLDDRAETYRINLAPSKYSIVEKVLKDFDSRRSELISKIRDIERFGKPLALYAGLNEKTLKTNIEGLDKILSPFNEDLEGLPLRKSILLLGPPGSGKTTLALEIVRQIRLQRLPEETALYLTFEGDIQQLAEDNAAFGWEYKDISACVRSLSTLQSKTYLNDSDKFFRHILNILDEFSPDLVAVDNLGYFLQLVPTDLSREILNRLIRLLTIRGITSILIGEDIPGVLGFESYDVDGVIYLHYKGRLREIEITKLRGREFAGGKHPFMIKSNTPPNGENHAGEHTETHIEDSPVIHIFPNIQTLLSISQEKALKKPKPPKREVLKSGVDGLDELLPLFEQQRKKNGFQEGEFILVLGSPGAGKTVLGLHFLKEGSKKKNPVHWVSFESDLDGLEMATRSFDSRAGFKGVIDVLKKGKKGGFKFYPPAQLNPHELVNDLLNICQKRKLKRLVLDSVTDVEQAFDSDIEFKSFMTSLVQLLREEGVTTMFLYRTRSFFGKTEDIGRVLSSIVDTIICLKVLEIQNAVQKGLFLLKVRGREHRSRLLSVDFKETEGMIVSDRGWTMSGLISGEAGEIKEPRVSVKLFFENRNEFLINALIVKEYNRRFTGGQTNFVHVRKPQIYSEFWSFRGSSGAGHANVRVVSLCDYWATLFHSQGKLYGLEEYVNIATQQLVHREEFWRRCTSYSFEKHIAEIFSIPNYLDVGVLAYHPEIINLKSFWEMLKLKGENMTSNSLIMEALASLTWNMLDPGENKAIMEVIREINNYCENPEEKKKKKSSCPSYLFAMPSLEERASFVSFFLEVYWSFGGVIFDLRKLFNEYADDCHQQLINPSDNQNPPLLFNIGIKLDPIMRFIGEILMLIPERILNSVIRQLNWEAPNFVSDICRHGEIILANLVKESLSHEKEHLKILEKRSAISNFQAAHTDFFNLNCMYEKKKTSYKNFIEPFIDMLLNQLKRDPIWSTTFEKDPGSKKKDIYSALHTAKEKIGEILKNGINEEHQKVLIVILFFVVRRILSNRERYHKLLKYCFGKNKLSSIEDIIKINNNKDSECARKTFQFLFQLVANGISPNPHSGDFSEKAYLARCWTGDIAKKTSLPEKDLLKSLDLYTPSEAYEQDNRVKKQDLPGEEEKSQALIAPLPSYKRTKDDAPDLPLGHWSYSVMGVWSLGITKPALSPEIGWIFIDALTEDKFVEMRARRGLGLPAKVSAYERDSIREAQPQIYGTFNKNGEIKSKGIVQYYDIGTQDKAQSAAELRQESAQNVQRRTRERSSIPFYYQVEEILSKELSRFFEPSYFKVLKKSDKDREKLIGIILKRIQNRIKNFLVKELKPDK